MSSPLPERRSSSSRLCSKSCPPPMKQRSYLASGARSPMGSSVTLQSMPRHSRRFFHGQHVSPVAVEVQDVGVQMADTKLHYFQNSFLPTRLASSARSGSMAVYVGMTQTCPSVAAMLSASSGTPRTMRTALSSAPRT